MPCAALPPCIRGRVRSTQSHDMVQLECIVVTSNVDLGCVSDSILAKELCQARSVFSFCCDGSKMITVECLVPLLALWSSMPFPESIIVQDLDAKHSENQVTVLTVAFVRDCMLANGVQTLQDACSRPPWMVPKEELQRWFNLCPTKPLRTPRWVLGNSLSGGQLVLQSTVNQLRSRRPVAVPRIPLFIHPWHLDPPLPTSI